MAIEYKTLFLWMTLRWLGLQRWEDENPFGYFVFGIFAA